MATNKVSGPHHPFAFGLPVRWRRQMALDIEGSICGFRQVDDAQIAGKMGVSIGTVLVLVETTSGDSFEVPMNELELI